jgi:hypothetical protein
MMGLQMKILAFLFPALGIAAGWILGTDGGIQSGSLRVPTKEGSLLVLITVTCFGILLSVICYSTSAEYSRYKAAVLGPRFQKLLGQADNPLDGSNWGRSPIGQMLTLATIGLWITVASGLCIVLWLATTTLLLWTNRPFPAYVALLSCYIFSILALSLVAISLKRAAWHDRSK